MWKFRRGIKYFLIFFKDKVTLFILTLFILYFFSKNETHLFLLHMKNLIVIIFNESY